MEQLIIEPKKGFQLYSIKELIRYKDLLYFMVLRDVTVVYKQTIMGFAWALLNPVFSMLVFTVIFGNLAKMPTNGIPYPIFSFAAVLPWSYFSAAMTNSTNSLIGSANLLSKVYFPRIVIPLTPVLSKLVDFFIAFTVLVVLMLFYRMTPSINLLALPLLILIMIMTAAGIGMWLSSLAIQYRDIKFIVPVMVQLMMYAAPVVFPSTLILEKFGESAYKLYALYPMAGVIEGFRAAVCGYELPWNFIAIGAISGFVIFVTGALYFKNMERYFADVA